MFLTIQEILPPGLFPEEIGQSRVLLPEDMFNPKDKWAFVYLKGLRKILTGRGKEKFSLWEVGCGTGLITLVLRSLFPLIDIRVSDYNPNCTRVTVQNLEATVGLEKITPLFGSWDLVSPPNGFKVQAVDLICACVPQVSSKMKLDEGDRLAHYYDPAAYPEAKLHYLGLGLNEALLLRAHRVLNVGGQIGLNLGGRPGINHLVKMFDDCGFCPEVVHQEIIEQHQETSVASMAQIEKDIGHQFEFFADKEGNEKITATEAENHRLKGDPVYHKIYFIIGTQI